MAAYLTFLLILSPLLINSKPQHLDLTTVQSIGNQFLRIVSGVPAQEDEFPYLAMLTRINGYVFCGGALISDYYVLTAAHCVENKLASGIIVRLGEYDWSTLDDGRHVNIPVKEIIIHPKFLRLTAYNDLALIRLDSQAPKTIRIMPICLPPNNLFSGEKVTTAGWGATDFNQGLISPVLQKLDMQVLSPESCLNRFGGTSIFLNKDKLCAWAEKKDSCKGDSGGPLVWEDSTNKPEPQKRHLVGIISMGFRCGQTNMPGLFTRITSYFDWIKSNINNDNTICWS